VVVAAAAAPAAESAVAVAALKAAALAVAAVAMAATVVAATVVAPVAVVWVEAAMEADCRRSLRMDLADRLERPSRPTIQRTIQIVRARGSEC
jgi:hypothetical protein